MKNVGQRAVVRLAGTYLAIIMSMSIAFSLIIYGLSSQEFHRRPPNDQQATSTIRSAEPGTVISIHSYLDTREDEAMAAIRLNLLLANLTVFLIGGLISYLLAQHTLQPIEDNMAAQSRFVSDASHELRTPLTALLSANEVALMNPKLTLKQAKQVITDNVDDVKRLHKLTNSMLGLLKEDKLEIQKGKVGLQSVIARAMNLVVNQALAKDIAIDDKTKNLLLLGDRQSLEQLFTILLDNAIKYSNKGGAIIISSSKKGKHVSVAVADAGIGMSDEVKSQIFTRFYRAEESRTTAGYGLGLSIAERIIRAHGGRINVDSEQNVGSTFTVILPAYNKKK